MLLFSKPVHTNKNAVSVTGYSHIVTKNQISK